MADRSNEQEFRYVGIQGWRSFLGAKKAMLDAYDQARVNAKGHEIEVSHRPVAEALFRKWLSDFLPKRYGVTSGFIVSQGEKEDVRLPHFDVIIYDQLESPVLWIENNPDQSAAGMSRAIHLIENFPPSGIDSMNLDRFFGMFEPLRDVSS